MAPSVASAWMSKLEKSVGADLLHRSTRKVALSTEGLEFLPYARDIVAREDAARAALGPGKILGLSCETEATVRAADRTLVDYLGVGPVFATRTKSDHKPPIHFTGLRALCALTPLPTVAIGGLTAAHVAEVGAAGADGRAVVSAICGQPDPRAAAQAFLTTRSSQ